MGLNEPLRVSEENRLQRRRLLAYAAAAVITLALITGAVVWGRGARAQTREDYVASGDALAADHHYPEAVSQYLEALNRDPSYGEARLRLGDAYLNQGLVASAMVEFVRAADLLPDDVDAQLHATRSLLRARRFDEAWARADRILRLEPRNVEALIASAAATARMADVVHGVFEIQQALRLHPSDPRVRMMLGTLQGTSRSFVEAEAAFTRAVELAPKSIDTLRALAVFYWRSGRLHEAETWLRRTVDLQPMVLDSRQLLASFLVATGRSEEAEEPLRTLVETTRTAAAQLALADYYVLQDQRDHARSLLERLAGRDAAAMTQVRLRLARIHYLERRTEEAHRVVSEVLARHPNDADALIVRAQLLLDEGSGTLAIDAAREAIGFHPAAANARLLLAEAHLARNDMPQAIKTLDEALAMDPLLLPARLRLSQLHLRRDDVTLALGLAEDAVRDDPDSVAARLVRAQAYVAGGELAAAEADLALVDRAAPNLPAVHASLGELELRRGRLLDARRQFSRALAVDPYLFEAIRGQATLEMLERHPARAIAIVDGVLKTVKDDPSLLLLAASVYRMTGNEGRIEATLRRVIELDASNQQAYVALANFYVDQNKPDEAFHQLEYLLTLEPDHREARLLMESLPTPKVEAVGAAN
jgi:tetratricopeptide (TPR) repeat protein